MAIVVTTIGHASTGSGTVTITPVTVASGSLIVVVVDDQSAASSGGTLSDGGINSYTSITSKANNNLTTNGFGQIFYAWNSVALSGATLTYTKVNTAKSGAMTALFATGVDTVSNPLDTIVTASTFGTGTTPSVTGGAPAVSGELIIGAVTWVGTASTDTFTQPATGDVYVAPPTFEHTLNGVECAGGFFINTGTGANTYAPTIVSHPWAAFIVGFKPLATALPFNQTDWPERTQEPWYRSWEISTTRFIGKDKLNPGQQYSDRPVLLQENWRRGWEVSNTKYIGQDTLNPGEQYYERPALLVEDFRRSWTQTNTGYIGKDALNPGKQTYDRPQLLSEDWRRGWEYTTVRYIGKDKLNPGKQVYDLPSILPEDWRRSWAQSLALNLIQVVRLPVGSQLYDLVSRSIQTQDYTALVNLLENTLTPTQIIELHFKPMLVSIGRLGNLGGLS